MSDKLRELAEKLGKAALDGWYQGLPKHYRVESLDRMVAVLLPVLEAALPPAEAAQYCYRCEEPVSEGLTFHPKCLADYSDGQTFLDLARLREQVTAVRDELGHVEAFMNVTDCIKCRLTSILDGKG